MTRWQVKNGNTKVAGVSHSLSGGAVGHACTETNNLLALVRTGSWGTESKAATDHSKLRALRGLEGRLGQGKMNGFELRVPLAMHNAGYKISLPCPV
ncbi:hypothetical protein E2C01_013419 [Portunus trituberculatus]|uniref:Uncharacterized protein n=1 Tax=Portunus trituberculatus TaxID=210409 RepID=A0A5B7DHA0_PORTR|nr:hypothetical protein [Portunus trituberculatus]